MIKQIYVMSFFKVSQVAPFYITYTLFQTSNYAEIFKELLANKTTHFSKHQTILTFSESYWLTILCTFPNNKQY